MDTAIITTRLVEFDAMSNFTMASAGALRKLGKVTVYAFAYERPMLDGVDVRLMGGANRHSVGTNLRALIHTFGLAKELAKYDVLLIVNPDVGSMPAYHRAKRHNPRLKVIWTFHGLTPAKYITGFRDRSLMRIRKPAYLWSMKRSDGVQVFSEYIKKEVTRGGVEAPKVVVVPFGIDLGRMAAGNGYRIREKYGIGEKFLLLYVGRLVGFKHVDELIKAVAMLDDARLLIVGGGRERVNLEALAKGLHVDERVRFAGRVPDKELPDYYAACDAWATASRHEGFCVPIVEAMAAGKPVIVPECGAIPETAGEAGAIYPAGDVELLSESIRSLASDGQLYDRLSSVARARAPKYDLHEILEAYVDAIGVEVGQR